MYSTYIHTHLTRSTQADTQCSYTNTNSFLLFLSLAEQDGGLLVGIYTYTHMYKVNPSSSWAQTHHLPCNCLWIQAPGHMGHQVFSPTPLAGTDPLTHVCTHIQSSTADDRDSLSPPNSQPLLWCHPQTQTCTWLSDHTVHSLDSLA